MANNNDLIVSSINKRIETNIKEHKDELQTLNLELIKKIITGNEKYVDRINVLKDDYNKSANYFSAPADKIFVVFTSKKNFFIGFDTVISDNRKRFLPIGGNVIKYEDMEDKYNDLVWVRLSDICGSEKYFSNDSLRDLNNCIAFLLEQYPDFYEKLFKSKKEKQKTILN